MKKGLTRFALVMASCFWFSQSQGQTLHAVIVGHTTDTDIGEPIKRNVKNLKDLLSRIAATQVIKVETKEIVGSHFNCKSIKAAVESLNVGPNDALFFHYSGHGFRVESEQLPEFGCQRAGDASRLEFRTVKNLLLSKRARFVLAIADTCNKVLLDNEIEMFAQEYEAKKDDKEAIRWKATVKRLFVDYSGSLTMIGARPGQEAYYRHKDSRAPLGGYFTNQFLLTMNNFSQHGDMARWEAIDFWATKEITTVDQYKQQPRSFREDLKAPS